VAIMEPQLTIFRPGIGIAQIYLACPYGFNLGTLENNACLKAFLDTIIMVSLTIDRYYAGTFRHMAILASVHRGSN